MATSQVPSAKSKKAGATPKLTASHKLSSSAPNLLAVRAKPGHGSRPTNQNSIARIISQAAQSEIWLSKLRSVDLAGAGDGREPANGVSQG